MTMIFTASLKSFMTSIPSGCNFSPAMPAWNYLAARYRNQWFVHEARSYPETMLFFFVLLCAEANVGSVLGMVA